MQKRCWSILCSHTFNPRRIRCHGLQRRVHSISAEESVQRSVPLRKQLKDEARAAKSLDVESETERGTRNDGRGWELTVGIEIHAQLNTNHKLFSVASTSATETANASVAPFDLSVPGTLPSFQTAVLVPAIRAALALKCAIQPTSSFDRKHYFYHDQPAGYQITQYYRPFARHGIVYLTSEDGFPTEPIPIGIKQVQLEQDTAKTQEQDEETTLVDYNRCGQPLIEIISLPQIQSPEAASAYVRKVQALLLSVNAVTTPMEMGGLRADVNVSVRRNGGPLGLFSYGGIAGLGQRTEIKNLSTLKGVEDAIRAERDRQIAVIEAGGVVEGETRGWSLAKPKETRRLRGKEGEIDYRYMPDPDIAPLHIGPDLVDRLNQTLPKSPDELLAMLTGQYGLQLKDAKILLAIDTGERLEYFEEVVACIQTLADDEPDVFATENYGQLAANWVLQEVGGLLTSSGKAWTEVSISPMSLAKIIWELKKSRVTISGAKDILRLLFDGDERTTELIIKEENLLFRPLSEQQYTDLAANVIAVNPGPVKDIRDKNKLGKLMFLVGQVMRAGPEGRMEAKKVEIALRQQIFDANTTTQTKN